MSNITSQRRKGRLERPERPDRSTVVSDVRAAGPDHQVVSLTGGQALCRKTPCSGCPWKVANTGVFPAEAFRHSANTAYDMSTHRFGCHESGTKNPSTCAGFLLHGADHNLSVRMDYVKGMGVRASDGGHELHASYRDMAIANGVSADDPVLVPCR